MYTALTGEVFMYTALIGEVFMYTALTGEVCVGPGNDSRYGDCQHQSEQSTEYPKSHRV